MPKVKQPIPDDDDINIDDLDIEEDPEPAPSGSNTKAVEKGLEAGLKAGLRTGVKEGIKPIAERIGVEAVNNILNGGIGGMGQSNSNSPIAKAAKDLTETVQLGQLSEMVERMQDKQRNKGKEVPIVVPPISPMNQMLETINTLKAMGVDTTQMDPMDMMMMALNPQMMPFVMMNQQNKAKSEPKQSDNNGNGNMFNNPLMMQMMMQMMQPKPAPPPEPVRQDKSDTIALMQMFMSSQQEASKNQQALLIELQRTQREADNAKTEQLMKRLNYQPPSFIEQMTELKEGMGAMKEFGFGQSPVIQNTGMTEIQARTLLEERKLAAELEREKMMGDRMDKKSDREVAMKAQDNERTMQLFSTAMNSIKNLGIENWFAGRGNNDQGGQAPQIPSADTNAIPSNRPMNRPITSKITDSINRMLKREQPEPLGVDTSNEQSDQSQDEPQ